MRNELFIIILCFVGLMQSEPIYLSNDLKELVAIRCLDGENEIDMEIPIKKEYIIGGKTVTYNLLQKNSLYRLPLNDQKSVKILMIAPVDERNFFEKTIEVASHSSVDYINLSELFGKDAAKNASRKLSARL